MAEPKEVPMFECALTELLEAKVSADLRPTVKMMCDNRALLSEKFAKLPAADREELRKLLPEDDRDTLELRHEPLEETMGLFKASLERIPSVAALRQFRNNS